MTAPLNKLDWWRAGNGPIEDDPPLWRDPPRLLLAIAAVCLIMGSLLPWAVGLDPVGRPDSYRPTQGTAEGVVLIAFGVLLLLLVRGRTLWETTSRSVQLLPLLVVLIGVPMWLGADHYSREVIGEWVRGGGSGTQTNARLIAGAGLLAVVAALIYLEWRRPAAIKARTQPLLVEWGFTRWGTTAAVVALVFGVIGAALGIILPALFLGAESMALAVFVAVFGLFIGIGLGLTLVGWLGSTRRGEADVKRPEG